MKILIEKLVHHKYDCDEIITKASPNYLKDTSNGEVVEINPADNAKHMFSEDISCHDLIVEIKDESDSYMYFFVNIQSALEGNKRYVIDKIIIDEGLSETYIKTLSRHAITTFVNGDKTTKHYIVTDKQYPFYSHTLKEIEPSVIDSIIKSYDVIKNGWSKSPSWLRLIKKIRKQMKIK